MKKLLGIGSKLLALVSLPIILLAVILLFYTAQTLSAKMDQEVKKSLHNIAYSMATFYETTYPEDYMISEDGIVTKGALTITDNFVMMDGIKSNLETDVTFFYGDTRTATTVKNDKGERAIGTKASDVVVEEVIKKGNDYFDTKVIVNGTPYYGYYVPLKNTDGSVVGMIFAGKSSEGVTADIQKSIQNNVQLVVIVLIAAMLVTVMFVVMLTRAIRQIVTTIAELAEGNLRVDMGKKIVRRKDELGDIARSVQKMETQFLNIVSDIQDITIALTNSAKLLERNSETTSETVSGINGIMTELAKGAADQAQETQSSAKNMNSMGEIIMTELRNVEELMNSAVLMKQAETEASTYINRLVAENDKTLNAVDRIEHQTTTTNESVQQIKKAVDVIAAIAKETNLLSLNASIEAARAGEHGKGFAVVAQQIQKLAEESNRSAKEIEIVIGTLSQASEQSILVMGEVKERVHKQIEDLTNTAEKFDEVRKGIEDSDRNSKKVEQESKQIDQYRSVVIDALQSLSAISEENAASTEETTASIQEVNAMMDEFNESAKTLSKMAEDLKQGISSFKL